MRFQLLSEAENQILEKIREKTIPIMGGVAGHGINHHDAVANYAYFIISREEMRDKDRQRLLFLCPLIGQLHDLRWFDGNERIARKLKLGEIPPEGKFNAEAIFTELKQEGIINDEEMPVCLEVIRQHGELPEPGVNAPLLLKAVRGADRLSRLGLGGLLSILEANRNYASIPGNDLPFYRDNQPIIWLPKDGLLTNEKIRSCVDDIHACLSWLLISETYTEWLVASYLARVNFAFLKLFSEQIWNRDYDYWIRFLNYVVSENAELLEDFWLDLGRGVIDIEMAPVGVDMWPLFPRFQKSLSE